MMKPNSLQKLSWIIKYFYGLISIDLENLDISTGNEPTKFQFVFNVYLIQLFHLHRVHTGFEWNKYNQTHYDMDNPPPKIVQGYKFNIFYPDLINKGSTPQYFLVIHLRTVNVQIVEIFYIIMLTIVFQTACGDNPEFAVLRFHAGPPYEDIAFKIVNREWEYSYKRGFRCQFHNNIFQLWFHFKRYRYRR